MTPTIGQVVLYCLRRGQADDINRRRKHARAALSQHLTNQNGAIVHVGNDVYAGDVFPMVITRVWGKTPESAVNGMVLLDGNDPFWATSVSVGAGEGTFSWPVRS